MDIRLVRQRESEHVYQVTLERDGKTTPYEFTWTPPPRPGWPEHVYEPPGQPCGVLEIPPLNAIIQYVYKVADGKSFDFPIVLDER